MARLGGASGARASSVKSALMSVKLNQNFMDKQHSELYRGMPRGLKLQATALPAVLAAIALLCCVFVVNHTVHGQAPQAAQKVKVGQLIDDLSQVDYDQREAAERQLIEIGSPAVDPLINALVDCTPDVCSRVKRILQAIAGECDEESLFKALAALRIRFEVPAQRIKPLIDRWAIQSRAAVVARWRKQGAIVEDRFESIDPVDEIDNQIQMRLQLAQQRNFQLEVVDKKDLVITQSLESPPAIDEPKEQWATQSIAEQLKLVLEGSLEQNKVRVLSSTNGAAGLEQSMNALAREPVSVTIGKDWRGEYSDFDFTGTRSSLPISSLNVQKKKINDLLLSVLKKHPIKAVTLNECSIAADMKQTLPASLSMLVIEDQDDSVKALELISRDSSALNRVRFVGSGFGKAEAAALEDFPLLAVIELFRLDLEKEAFEGITSLEQVHRVLIERCKFPASAFIKFQQVRSDVVVIFTARAFLGVGRDPPGLAFNRNGNIQPPQVPADGCVIFTVVQGGAAAQAGMKSGDVVLSVGDQKVRNFEELRIAIAQCDIGEEVSIKIRRDGKEKTLQAKMGNQDE